MKFFTTPTLEGHNITEYCGVVTGEAILGANIFRDFFAGIRDIVGGHSGAYEKELRKARQIAFSELKEQAKALGANAVVGIDIDYETVGKESSMLMVSVTGTVVICALMRLVLLLALMLLLSACQSGPEARHGYWADTAYPAQAARPRIKVVVIHYTAEDFSSSLATLTDREVSAHYLIPQQPPQKAGKAVIWQLVPESQLAWHAGPSFWRGTARINDTSIGIEIVNQGYRCTLMGLQWQPFTPAQISALTALVRDISQRYGISAENIVGHSDIAPQRKQDPGPLFPWQQLARQGLGAWPDVATVQRYLHGKKADAPVDQAKLLNALQRYGYGVTAASTPPMQRKLIAAFQIHFRPRDYRGLADAETLAIARALLAKYGAAF